MVVGSGLTVTTSTAYATDGIVDTAFGTNGQSTQNFATTANGYDSVYNIAVNSDGTFLAVGYVAGSANFVLVKYLRTGELDTSFGTAGIVSTDFAAGNDDAKSVKVLSNGSILVAGTAQNSNGDSDFAIAKFTANGVLDTSFGSGGKMLTDLRGTGRPDDLSAMSVSPTGAITLVGYSRGITIDWGIARVTAEGVLDTTFSTDGIVTLDFSSAQSDAKAVESLSSGSVIVAGYTENAVSGATESVIVKIDSTGNLDSAFGVGGKVISDFHSYSEEIKSLSISASGSIFAAIDGVDFHVVKYLPNGVVDTTFGTAGLVRTDFLNGTDPASSVQVLFDGSVLLAGGASMNTGYDFAITKYTTLGILDTTFGTAGKVTVSFTSSNDVVNSMAILDSGQILLAGVANSNFAVTRLSGNTPIVTTTTSSTSTSTSITVAQSSESTATTTAASVAVVMPTTSIFSTTVAKAPVLRVKKYDYTGTSLARFVNMKILKTSKASITVMKSSKKYCQVVKNRLRGLRVGQCRVTVKVKAKNGKITSKRVSLQVVKQKGK
jgi:uncharacterized delta-60 repeat protein